MSAVERYEDRSPATVDSYRRLGEWAASAQAAYDVAEQLVKTSFVPEGFRGKPYEATAAILAGLELGLDPMASLRSFDVIQGQAAPRAITLRAVAQAQGHELELVESSATRCRMRGRRAGTQTWQTVDWTIDRAKALGVTGKHNWKVQPQAMLVARATSELARLIAADAILGIAYSAEEIADGAVDAPAPVVERVEATTPGTKRMTRKKAAPAALPEPDPEPEALYEEEQEADARATYITLSDPQMKKLRALYNDVGIRDAAEQKATTATILGLPSLATHNDLTVDQASELIETLNAIDNGFLEWTRDDDGVIVGYRQADDSDR